MKRPGEAVAINLQSIRESRNLSLDKLAEMTSVSKSMLRQIEIGQSNPTIATIWKIANGLRIPFTALLKEQTQDVTLGAFKAEAPLATEIDGYRIFPLIAFNPERAFETYYLEIEPGVIFEAQPHQGNAEEHIFVMQGLIEINIADEAFVVERQHFISFQADCFHSYHNNGADLAIAIMTISYFP